jgi:hypothetical protein
MRVVRLFLLERLCTPLKFRARSYIGIRKKFRGCRDYQTSSHTSPACAGMRVQFAVEYAMHVQHELEYANTVPLDGLLPGTLVSKRGGSPVRRALSLYRAQLEPMRSCAQSARPEFYFSETGSAFPLQQPISTD